MGQCCGAPGDSRGAADLKKLDVDSKYLFFIQNHIQFLPLPQTIKSLKHFERTTIGIRVLKRRKRVWLNMVRGGIIIQIIFISN